MSQYISFNQGAVAFSGGVDGVAAKNLVYRVSFDGTWALADQFKFDIVTASQTLSCGQGRMTQVVPTYAITLNNRVHLVAGPTWYGSDNNDCTHWEQQYAGAFFITASNRWSESETLVSLAPYQGRMAVFSARTTQIWIIDPNPANFSVQQILSNIGTYCPTGPQSIGDLDVLFPSTTGMRSLRVRDSSLNAFINDIGSPIDLDAQTAITGLTPTQLKTSCSIVEPSANRFWHYVNPTPSDASKGVLFALSYFPAAKIMAAWSKYVPSYYVTGVLYYFTPTKFVTYQSIVYCRATSGADSLEHVFAYGGTTGQTYDTSVVTAATTWLDLRKPGRRKQALSLDYALAGSWQFYGSMDWSGVNGGGSLQAITNAPVSAPSFQLGEWPWSDDGFHVKLQAVSSGTGAATLSSLVFHYNEAEEK